VQNGKNQIFEKGRKQGKMRAGFGFYEQEEKRLQTVPQNAYGRN
jgi:hypothetical protein